ncbi:hypothetical protein KC340_g7957 [Hortaea werneckii]|nr:hypothetical protein KC342_g6546 [Hortaea werneckii]KAI7098620.1 hypothetical protein KC339_g8835 [Hortaea werneckii]KAI7230419.1 hypothetical protein KC365_g7631 [Hortaea werneckii]KAI7319026.1 hypothetical protein KC340_g7957 [Hortaea werneckii]KAI7399924.1 hypothetical protein KC328_g3800 [Hortaea werneckii]
MDDTQKRKAPTDPTSGADIRSTTSSSLVDKIARLSLEHQSSTGPTTTPRTVATPRQRQIDPPDSKAVTFILRSNPTDRVLVNEDLLRLMEETATGRPAQNKPSSTNKKNKNKNKNRKEKKKKNKKENSAAANETASVPSFWEGPFDDLPPDAYN